MMRCRQSGSRPQVTARGFSLVELAVSLVLGLIIIGGAASVYLASKQSMTEVEQVGAISENGRFALQLLKSSVRHIGFYGGSNPADIREDGSLAAVGGTDCTNEAAAYDTENSFFAVRAAGTPGTSVSVLGCITDALANTDVLVIKGVAPSPLYDANPDDPNAPRDGTISFPSGAWSDEETYVIANSERGILLDGADTPPSVAVGGEFALGVAWPYRMQIYYIRQIANAAIPTLSRKILAWDGAAMSVQTQDLVQGVENVRYLFGFDSTNDGSVDTLGNLTEVGVPSADNWDQVMSLQVFLLIRSDVADPDYTDEKTYTLGDLTVTPGDNMRRILLYSDIAMRNPGLNLRGGA